jgi:NTE family protein
VRAGGVLSYLLFDGGFAGELIALGRADARAQHAALVAQFTRPAAPA